MLVLIKNHLNYLKNYIFKFLFKEYNRFYFKNKRNLFRLKKKQNDTAINNIRNLFRLKKEVKEIKDIVLRNIKNLFEYEKEEENYHKPISVNSLWSNNYTEYKSNGDKNEIPSVEEYLYENL